MDIVIVVEEQVDLRMPKKLCPLFLGAYMCASQYWPHDLRHCIIYRMNTHNRRSLRTHKRRHLERLRRDAALVMSGSVSALSTVIVVLLQTLEATLNVLSPHRLQNK